MKPVIGIVTKFFNNDTYYGWSWQRISNSLRYALIKNGAKVFGILPQANCLMFQEKDEHEDKFMDCEEQLDFISFLNLCDGVILQGGMNSGYYEEFAARYCYKKDIPLLGICAGYNTIIRALGGTTRRLENNDHEKPFETYAHGLKVTDEDSLFYKIVKQKEFPINSIHLYVGDKIPDTLSVVAQSSDGHVEVVEAKNKKFFMGIKYHPELLCDTDEIQNNIIKSFVEVCTKK